MHLRRRPVETLTVLNPFEIRYGHASSIGQNVGNYHHVLLRENVVGGGGDRPVRQFEDDMRFDVPRVPMVDGI